MIIKPKFVIFVLVAILIPVGVIAAYSSASYVTHRFATIAAGSAASAQFSVTGFMGQPVTDSAQSQNYKVTGGFLPLPWSRDGDVWLPVISK